MIVRAAAAALAAAIGLSAPVAHAQGMMLQIEIRGDNTRPIRPQGAVNTLQDLMTALAACWSPPPLDARRQPLDLTFQVSFKRNGEMFGKPRAIQFARDDVQGRRARRSGSPR